MLKPIDSVGAVLVAAMMVGSGCSSGDSGTNGSTAEVAMITVTPTSVSLTYGDEQLFQATARDADGNVVSANITWSVTDVDMGSITRVSGNGSFTAGRIAPLNGQVIARVGDVADTAEVSIVTSQISFANDLLSTFQGTCAASGCHSSGSQSGGLVLESHAGLMAGGSHGPVVSAGNPAGSIIIQKLGTNPPFGSRMPLSGSVTQGWINKLYVWIQQGAQNNAPPPRG